MKNKGFLAALAAYTFWGFFPLFWKLLDQYSAWEILIHRVVWSFLFYLFIVLLQGKFNFLLSIIKKPELLWLSLASAILIAINWLVFIWSINSGQVIESAFGYFISPILNIFLGLFFFKEKLSKKMFIAFSLVFISVGWLLLKSHQPPWLALSLAITFSLYGVIRKISRQEAILHSTIESGLLVPLVLIASPWICTLNPLTAPIGQTSLLALGGILTGFILWLFAIGARKLSYSTMGFLQFISPSLQFLVGYFLFKEPLSPERLVSFAVIWLAVAIAIWDLSSKSKRTS